MRPTMPLALALAVFTALSAPAMADITFHTDANTYAGASCQSTYHSYDLLEQHYGRMFNISTTSNVWFHCPIVKRTNAADDYIYVNADVIDMHYSEDVTCTLFTLWTTTTSPSGYWDTTTSSGTSTTPQRLTMFNGYSSSFEGAYDLLICSVPEVYAGSKSGLAGYSHAKEYWTY